MSYLDNQLCVQLYISSRDIIKCHEKYLRALKLTYPRALVLLALKENNPCFIDIIAKKIDLDTGTLSPLIKYLLKDNFITKNRDPSDERKVLLTLTSQGIKKVEEIKNVFETTASKIGLIDTTKKELLNFLKKLKR